MLTPIYRLRVDTLHNLNVVKVLLASDGRGLYVSAQLCPTGAI